MIVVLFGVAGSGKTTLGQILASELGWSFYDADEFHSPENIDKMHGGAPLTDADREPWLQRVRGLIERCLATNENAVIACSALKRTYRERLCLTSEVRFVYLRGTPQLIAARLKARRGHFMESDMSETQFATLEEPGSDEETITIDIAHPPHALIGEIKQKLSL